MARRRSWSVRFVVGAGLIVLVLLGRGLGVLPSGAEPRGDGPADRGPARGAGLLRDQPPERLSDPLPEAAPAAGGGGADPDGTPARAGEGAASASPAAGSSASAGAAAAGAPAVGSLPVAGEVSDGVSLPGATPGAGAASTPTDPAQPAASPGAEQPRPVARDDARLARLAMVRTALGEQRPGAACALLERLRAEGHEELPGFAELMAAADQRVRAACGELLRHLRAGEVLAARPLLAGLLLPASEAAHAALADLCREQGWPRLSGPAAAPVALVPTGALRADRTVRVRRGEGYERCRLVAVADAEVTLRVVGREGVTFPTVPVWTVEPEAVTAEEATELAVAALHGGAVDHARLWCACALLRGERSVGRLAALVAALE